MSTERDDGLDEDGTNSTARPADGERPSRRPRLAVAAVAVAVLVAGGGGAWWATAANGGKGGGKAGAAPAPLRMDGPGLPVPVTGGGPAPTDGGPAPYRLTGTLPKGPDRAAVYAAGGSVTAADVQHLAKLLGVPGPVRAENGSWRAGGAAGTAGPSLLVSKDAPGIWAYDRDGDPAVGTRAAPADGSDQQAPSPAAAGAAAAPLLKGLGLSGARVDASVAVGALRTVSVDPRVGGLPTHGWTTSLEMGSDGRTDSGYGRLAGLAKGDTYPVVSAAAALKELDSTRVMHPDYGLACTSASPSPTATAAPGDGGPRTIVPPCVPGSGSQQPTEVRGASFGLALEYVAGAQTLVPAWLFDTAREGSTQTSVVAQTAVDPKYVRTGPSGGASTPPSASAPPSVNPGGPIRPSPPAGGTTVHRVPVSSYTAAGSTLTLSYEGGLCDTYRASASESGGTVRVSVVATPKPKGTVCPMIMRTFTQKVTLAAALGGRTVVDASNGQRVAGR